MKVERDEAMAFADSPATYFDGSWHAMQHVETARLQALQLEALRLRFEDLHRQIPALAALTAGKKVTSIEAAEDVVPLLFEPSAYKSYPDSLLIKNNFTALTRWLDRLTTHQLAEVDVSAADSIDSWLEILDAETQVRVAHSSGTSGTMSFLPRAQREWDEMFLGMRAGLFQFSDPLNRTRHDGEYFDLVWPLFRHGRGAITRLPDMALPHIMGSEERVHALRPGRLSSDGMLFAARLALARSRGEDQDLEINPALVARRQHFLREQQEMAEDIPRFITALAGQLQGKRVWLFGTWNVLYRIARAALDEGLEGVFAPDSLVTAGGGAKGRVLPDDWEQTVMRFAGVARLQHAYAMTESTGVSKLCEFDRYHYEPWIVPFVLDPDTGRTLPRQGEAHGRAAFFDLMPSSYWGGFITGDEITLDHRPCRCGRTTAHSARSVQRLSA